MSRVHRTHWQPHSGQLHSTTTHWEGRLPEVVQLNLVQVEIGVCELDAPRVQRARVQLVLRTDAGVVGWRVGESARVPEWVHASLSAPVLSRDRCRRRTALVSPYQHHRMLSSLQTPALTRGLGGKVYRLSIMLLPRMRPWRSLDM